MGYYGASMYRGDYYGQGDFYRGYSGDPGFFDFISDVGKGIVGVASKVLPYAAPIIGTASALRSAGAEVAFGIGGHVDLRRHGPFAAGIGDERFAHRLQCTLGRDRLAHVCRVEERDHLDQPPVSPL